MQRSSTQSKPQQTYCRVLSIAGSDSGGGAGIQADLKTISALGCYGMTVITALTAQNTLGVAGIRAVPPEFVEAQIDAVLSDIGADAVKIGMLFSAELIQTVANRLKTHETQRIVLDPVMVAQSGDKLLQDDAIEAIKIHLMPLATVVAPNLPEAAVLLNRDIDSLKAAQRAAIDLMQYGSQCVLLKGGHSSGDTSLDVLCLGKEKRVALLEGRRVITRNNHGTGCTLSSAIAAFLAKGDSVETAVKKAKQYITDAIRAGAAYTLGGGHGPVHHFFKYW
jgi:hydroxymethylpyrimidine/phosphomethylpyrimidine kinase